MIQQSVECFGSTMRCDVSYKITQNIYDFNFLKFLTRLNLRKVFNFSFMDVGVGKLQI